jgi:hypothetical protein
MQHGLCILRAQLCWWLFLHVEGLSPDSPPLSVQVLDGADSQYLGMQIGQPQEDDEEGAAGVLSGEVSDVFRNSSLGKLLYDGNVFSLRHLYLFLFVCLFLFVQTEFLFAALAVLELTL